ncbi:aminoglycoside phosphotransferase family protein [Streptomyces diastaticus]|uniref:aminoglycoside phosphotransferase family protein n=1 Tax=Streptomyces diastaticus TaxID=1956 RepID=UPI00382E9E44
MTQPGAFPHPDGHHPHHAGDLHEPGAGVPSPAGTPWPGLAVPPGLAASQARFNGARGRDFVAALPGRAARFREVWGLRPDGPAMHGTASLVLPVRLPAHGDAPAVLKLQLLDEESAGEGAALRAWNGDAAARLLAEDPATGTLLIERLDAGRPLAALADTDQAVTVLGALLARLSAHAAPPGTRRLADIAARLVADAPRTAAALGDPFERALLTDVAAAVREVLPDAGDRLLHWDLHYGNVLAPYPGTEAAARGAWLAIDPKPLAGDPGFDLAPALHNRFDPGAVRRRFDALTALAGLDRARAARWTLARVLQETRWNVLDGAHRLQPDQAHIARVLLGRA